MRKGWRAESQLCICAGFVCACETHETLPLTSPDISEVVLAWLSVDIHSWNRSELDFWSGHNNHCYAATRRLTNEVKLWPLWQFKQNKTTAWHFLADFCQWLLTQDPVILLPLFAVETTMPAHSAYTLTPCRIAVLLPHARETHE